MVTVDMPFLSVSERPDLVTIELARPDSLNALNAEMIEGLHAIFGELHDDPGPGVLVTGEGEVTCAGMDRDIVSQDYETEFAELNETLGEVYRRIETYPGPVAVAGRGALVGAGALISLSCEFLVLGAEATYAFPEVQYEIASDRIATRVPEMAGKRIGTELALTGEPIDPERAYEVGLANDVVAPEDAEDRARELLAAVTDNDDETVARLIEMIQGSPVGESTRDTGGDQ